MSVVRFFNTLTRRVEPFEPLEPGVVRMYCCGPTVYNYIHIGNLRTFLWGDLLRRYLQWRGYRVTQVMNLTDVEDKIIRSANEKGEDIITYTLPYIEAFYADLDTLRIRRADLYPKATDHIDEMVDIVKRLTDRGHTYVVDGSTYFRIATFPSYGALSQIELQITDSSFSRIESDEYEKEDARDFVLWKSKKENEPSWTTEIGEGRPGWHLECSAMSMKYLGESFDMHTGAVDLIFPHHENEIAQSEGATGRPFVKYWIHGEHLIVEDRKMSKSARNFYTLRDLIEQGYTPLQIRYALLAVPYRTKLNFTLRSLDDAKQALERLELFMIRLADEESLPGDESGRGRSLVAGFLDRFREGMDDDLNTAAGVAALFTLIRDANTAFDEKGLTGADAKNIRTAVEKVDQVFDLLSREQPMVDAEIEAMIEARNAARARRDFQESDRLRDELLAKGIILEDTAGRTRWRRK
jgi:cysteinyl-tRNA synthetase